jgi:ATP phosphoribosyltransferase
MTLKLGIPSKGRLMADTFDWFAARGVTITRTGTDREYAGRVDGVDGVELVLLAAGEIPRELASGRIHLGVTGSDVVQEKIARWDSTDVRDLNDLDAAADAFRRTHGFRLRIATKYHRLVRAHLKAAGVASYQLVDSQGATEGTVVNLTAEAIADITSTGATLDANHLKEIGDVIHVSQATLFRSLTAELSSDDEASLSDLRAKIGILSTGTPKVTKT